MDSNRTNLQNVTGQHLMNWKRGAQSMHVVYLQYEENELADERILLK
jgi:hypothetical protein